MPPVRERSEDVLLLAQVFLAQMAKEEGKAPVELSEAAAHALKHYSWPGNVRQLENAMRQLVLLGPAEEITEAAVYRIISVPRSRLKPMACRRSQVRPSLSAVTLR